MVDIQTVSIAVASASVVAAATYYIFQIQHQYKLRQTDLVIRLYSTYGNPEFQEAETKTGLMEFTDYDDYRVYGISKLVSRFHNSSSPD